jgi:hypothetical protein
MIADGELGRQSHGNSKLTKTVLRLPEEKEVSSTTMTHNLTILNKLKRAMAFVRELAELWFLIAQALPTG